MLNSLLLGQDGATLEDALTNLPHNSTADRSAPALTASLLSHLAKDFLAPNSGTDKGALDGLLGQFDAHIDDEIAVVEKTTETVREEVNLASLWKAVGQDRAAKTNISHKDNARRVERRNQRLHESIANQHSPTASNLSGQQYSFLGTTPLNKMAQLMYNERGHHTPLSFTVEVPRVSDSTSGASMSHRNTPYKMLERVEQNPPLVLRSGMAALFMNYTPASLPEGVLLGGGKEKGSVSAVHSTLYSSQVFAHSARRTDFLLVLRPKRNEETGVLEKCGATLRQLPSSTLVSGHSQPCVAIPKPLSPELLVGLRARVDLLCAQRLVTDFAGNDVPRSVLPKEFVDYLFMGQRYEESTASEWFWQAKKLALKQILDEHFTPNFSGHKNSSRPCGDIAEMVCEKTVTIIEGWSVCGYFASPQFVEAKSGGTKGVTPELVCTTEAAGQGLKVAASEDVFLCAQYALCSHEVRQHADATLLSAVSRQGESPKPRRGRTPPPKTPGPSIILLRRMHLALRMCGPLADPSLLATMNKLLRVSATEGWAQSVSLKTAISGGPVFFPPWIHLARLVLKPKEFMQYCRSGVFPFEGSMEGSELLQMFYSDDEVDSFSAQQRAAVVHQVSVALKGIARIEKEDRVYPKHTEFLQRMADKEAALLGARTGVSLAASSLSRGLNLNSDPFTASVSAFARKVHEEKSYILRKTLPKDGSEIVNETITERRKALLSFYSTLFGEKPKPKPKPKQSEKEKPAQKAAGKPAGKTGRGGRKAAAKPARRPRK